MLHVRALVLFRTVTVLLVTAASLRIFMQEASGQVASEIYLVSGFPSGDPDANVPTSLYRVSREDKVLKLISGLLPASESTDFIRTYYDRRLLVVATPHFMPKRLILLNMDAPCQPRFVDINSGEFLPNYTYLLDVPDRGMYLAAVGFSVEESRYQLLIFSLITGQQETMEPDVLKYAMLPGLSGLGHEDGYQMDLLIDPNGFLRKTWKDAEGRRLIDLDWPALPYASQPEKKTGRWPLNGIEQSMSAATWFIGTATFDLVYPRKESADPQKLNFQLLDKSRRIWREVTVPSEYPNVTQLKPFGSWLAGVPVGKSITGAFPKEMVDKIKAEKREKDHRYDKLLVRNPKAELFLYDTKTGKDYTISTGDIESEVLLIENDIVYYRVKDRLYSSMIREGRVEEPQLLVQDPALMGVYWAFSGPFCEADSK